MIRDSAIARTAPPPFPFEDRDKAILAALLGLFLVPRLAWLAWNPESVSYFEESYRWVVAHEWLHTRALSVLEYQADHYQGGSLVMAALAVPWFAVLGESAGVLKLAALTVSLGILASLYVIGRRFFNRPVAVLAALGYTAGPPLVTYNGLVVMGSHPESVLLSLLQILVFLHILYGARRPAVWALLGLVSGLGIWFCYTTGLSLIACAVAWLALQRLPRPAALAAFALGLVAGLVPWLIYNLHYDFAGITRVLQVFGARETVDPWDTITMFGKLRVLVEHDLAYGLLAPIPDVFNAPIVWSLAVPYGVPLLLALGAAFLRSARAIRAQWARAGQHAGVGPAGAEVVFVTYGLVFLGLYLTSSFTVDPLQSPVAYRLFVTPAVLLLIPAAVSAARALLTGSRLVRFGAAAVGVAWLGVQVVGDVGIALHPSVNTLSLDGGYICMGLLTFHKYPDDPARVIEIVRRLPEPEQRRQAFMGVGWRIEFGFEKTPSEPEFVNTLEAMPPEDRLAVLDGVTAIAHVRIDQVRNWERAKYAFTSHYAALPARLQTLLDIADSERSRTQMALYRGIDLRFSRRARLLRSGQRLRIAVSSEGTWVDDRRYALSTRADDPPATIRIGVWVPIGAAIRIVTPDGNETLRAERDLSMIERPIRTLPFEIEVRNEGKRNVLVEGWLGLRAADALDVPSGEDGPLARYRVGVLPKSPFRIVDGWNRREGAGLRLLHSPSDAVWRWTRKPSAVAVFANPRRLVGLRIEGMLPEDLAREPLHLEMAVNGEPIGRVEGQQDFAVTPVLDPDLLGDADWADLELRVSRTVNPKHLGVSEDSRDLGVYLRRLDLTEIAFDLPAGGRIDLGAPDARKYLEQGWSYDERDAETTFVWAVANEARVQFTLAAPRDHRLEMRVYPLPESLPRKATVHVNDERLAQIVVTGGGWQTHTIEIPADALKAGLNRIRFTFDATATPAATSGDRRALALAFDAITVR